MGRAVLACVLLPASIASAVLPTLKDPAVITFLGTPVGLDRVPSDDEASVRLALDGGRVCQVFVRIQDAQGTDVPAKKLAASIESAKNLQCKESARHGAAWTAVAKLDNSLLASFDWQPGAVLEIRPKNAQEYPVIRMADWQVHLPDGKPYDSPFRVGLRWVWLLGSVLAAGLVAAWASSEKFSAKPKKRISQRDVEDIITRVHGTDPVETAQMAALLRARLLARSDDPIASVPWPPKRFATQYQKLKLWNQARANAANLLEGFDPDTYLAKDGYLKLLEA